MARPVRSAACVSFDAARTWHQLAWAEVIIQASTIGRAEGLETDICVVGAGPAGISLALGLIGRGLRVTLVESGAFEHDPQVQELSAGDVRSDDYAPGALGDGRRRQFGGTTNLWAYRTEPGSGRRYARSLPPEEIDFERRGEEPGAGWPFRLADLARFLERAQRVWNGGPFDYSVETWGDDSTPPLQSPRGMLITRMSQHGPRDVFTLRYRDDLLAAEDVTVLVQCTAVELEWDAASRVVRRAIVARGDGSRFAIAARAFVLASGGIENVQLLLASDATRPGGPANPHDVIGRWITDHPEFRMAVVSPADASVLDRLGLYDIRWVRNSMVSGFLTLPEALKRDEGLLNVSVAMAPQPAGFGSRSHRALSALRAIRRREVPSHLATNLAALAGSPRETIAALRLGSARYMEHLGGWSRPDVDRSTFAAIELWAATEQSASRDNRLHLSEARDRLGRPRIAMEMRWSDEDRRNFQRSATLITEELEASGIGRVRPWVEMAGAARPYNTGYHHPMGGTRMHPDPRFGAVDPDCRVHGTANLYVAGSSVFASGHGYANPTLSIIALAVRLGDHLIETLS